MTIIISPIVHGKKHKVKLGGDKIPPISQVLCKKSVASNNLTTLDFKICFTQHKCKLKLVHRSLNNNKKLSTLKLHLPIKRNKFRSPIRKTQRGSSYQIKHKKDKNLDLSLCTHLYGRIYKIVLKTDELKKLLVKVTELQSLENTSRFVSYVNFLNSWWPPEAIAASIGVPTYSAAYSYNVINLTFWTTNQGPVDAALLWSNAITYVSEDNPWGKTTKEVQEAWINLYHEYGVKVLVSAFGATDFPTTQGADPIEVAEALANFVINNNLDGVDLDWEDNAAMENSTGEPWLISCTEKLRELLPSPYIISHAPQAPYFMGVNKYPAGGYLKINSDVGYAIDYYNIQFYNQDSSEYTTYETLFNTSDGWASNTAVKQIEASGVPKEKLIVGKGVVPADFYNTGYVPVDDLATFLKEGVQDGYNAGFMGWQFSSDPTGSWSNTLAKSFD